MNASLQVDVERVVGQQLRGTGESGVVLAVSGGRDSMVLLHAAAAGAPETVRGVATYDHGTGTHATAAVALVEATAHALGVPVIAGRAGCAGRTEAEWRDARWHFLRACVRDLDAAAVATAHTRDDQYETVALRALRGSAARGLAALGTPTLGIVRPLLTVERADVAAYATAHGVGWIEDPSNGDRRHLRVRLRTVLLPAIDRVAPGAAPRVLALAESAAQHRAAVERWVTRLCLDDSSQHAKSADAPIVNESLRHAIGRSPRVLVSAIAGCDAGALALFWPAFAARAGARLDRRAIARLVAYTPRAAARIRDGTVQPARIPVAGVAESDPRGSPGAAAPVQHVVTLEHATNRTAPNGRAWQFVVRAAPVDHRRGHAAPRPAAGMAAPRSSDYA